MKNKFFLYASLICTSLMIVLCFPACSPESNAQNDLQKKTPVLEVIVSKPVQKEIVEWDEYTGRFEPIDDVEIRARVSGYLDKVLFKEGQIVKAGDLLFIIDQRPFKIAVESAQGELEQALAEKQYSELQLARLKQLRKENAVSEQQLDEIKLRNEDASGRVKIAQARLEQAKLNLKFSEIKAPVSGRIGRVHVTQGNLIVGGDNNTTLLTTIVSLDPIYFIFELDENNFLKYQRLYLAGKRQTGREAPIPVKIKLLDEKTYTHEGQMNFLDNQFDLNTGTILARATLSNPNFLINPGQFGRLRLLGSAAYEAILVPANVVLTDQTKQFVYIVDKNNQVKKQNIVVGPVIDGMRVVRSGLTGDENVVTSHIQLIRSGMTVKPILENSSESKLQS